MDCWLASTPGRVGIRWSAPRRVRRCAPGEARHPGPAEHEGDLNPEPSARRTRINETGVAQVQKVRAPSLVESDTRSLWTPE